MKTEKKPAGRYVSLAQVVWAWAKLERCAHPREMGYAAIWRRLVETHGEKAVNAAADTCDRDLYVQTGWEAAL